MAFGYCSQPRTKESVAKIGPSDIPLLVRGAMLPWKARRRCAQPFWTTTKFCVSCLEASKAKLTMRLLLALFALLPGAVAEVSLKDRMTAAVAHGLAKVRANHSIANKSRRLFTPGDILPFDFELDPVEMSDCTTPTLLGGTGGDCFSICFFTTWLCEGIFDIADNICDAYADVGSVGIGAAVSAGVAAVIPGVLWDLPMAATMGLLAKEFVEPLFDQATEDSFSGVLCLLVL